MCFTGTNIFLITLLTFSYQMSKQPQTHISSKSVNWRPLWMHLCLRNKWVTVFVCQIHSPFLLVFHDVYSIHAWGKGTFVTLSAFWAFLFQGLYKVWLQERQEDINKVIAGLQKKHIQLPGINMCLSVTVNRRVAVVDLQRQQIN